MEVLAATSITALDERGKLFGTMGREKNPGGEGAEEESIATAIT
jgi:hypothetical protein